MKWISFKEDFPRPKASVLLYRRHKDETKAILFAFPVRKESSNHKTIEDLKYKDIYFWIYTVDGSFRTLDPHELLLKDSLTHWMSLPGKPAEFRRIPGIKTEVLSAFEDVFKG